MRFSRRFHLSKTQAELDFVDVDVNGDVKLFIDPFAIARRTDLFSQRCHTTIVSYFDRLLNAVRNGDHALATELVSFLREPNEIRLGLSEHRPQGAGIGRFQAQQLIEALQASAAVRTGFLNHLEESDLMIDGIGPDKISDLATNVIRAHLAEYTNDQCVLLGVPVEQAALPPHYSLAEARWVSEYFPLPVVSGRPVLLVPKTFVRVYPAYNPGSYYRHHVLPYLQAEHLDANSALVHVLKNGKRVVHKKSLEAIFPLTKDNLFQFSREHPEVLRRYRERLIELEKRRTSPVQPEDEALIAGALIAVLRNVAMGSDAASQYHTLMIGVVEFLFFPILVYPRKEHEIHDGRKRIDILMQNGASDGIFYQLHTVRNIPCSVVPLECKNYRTDIENPELDQLAGRFSVQRGQFGMLCCRHFQDRALFIARCRDTFRDARGLIVPLDDATIIRWLGIIRDGNRSALDRQITDLINEVFAG